MRISSRLGTILLFVGALALLAGAVFIYGPALSFPPQFDDYGNIVENRAIRYLSHPRVFIESIATRSRPLTFITYAINYQFGGLSLSGLRTGNVLLHLANALLVGLLFLRWRPRQRGRTGALFAAGIFLLAPLAVESVVYLSARSSLLALFFVLLALWFQGVRRPTFWSWVAFHAAAVAAFLSKESAVTLLPLLALSLRTSGGRWRELWSYAVPIVVGGLVVGVGKLRYLVSAYGGFYQIQGDLSVHGLGEFVRLHLSLWPRILRLLVDPRALSIDHTVVLPSGWQDPAVLAGLAIWGFGIVLLVFWLRKPGPVLLAPLWVFASLAVTNSIWPVLDPLSERHVYAALPALGWGVAAILAAMGRGPLWAGFLLWPVLAGASAERASVWRSEGSLWMDAYGKYPAKMRVAYNAWNGLLREEGGIESAFTVAKEFLARYRPGSLSQEQQDLLLQNAVFLLRGEGSISADGLRERLGGLGGTFVGDLLWLEAMIGQEPGERWLARWRETLAKHREVGVPNDPQYGWHQWQMLLARFYLTQKNYPGALAAYELVERAFPPSHALYWSIREPLGDLYLRLGRPEEALAQYERAAYQHKMSKRFPLGLQWKIYEIYAARQDWLRASDALGEVVRVLSDDAVLRARYAEALENAGTKSASQQKLEAAYYERFRVPSESEKEHLKP